MRWSLRIGRVSGIGIYVHVTFVLIVAWVAFAYWSRGETVAAAVEGVIFILALFGCVVLHELGHALTAQRFGIKTRDITLLPIGGIARLERMPKEPMQELAVALAGPAVNVAIAIAIYVGLVLTGTYRGFGPDAILTGGFLERLMIVNVFLVVFNMLPAFPMDGGRALRAVLATRMSPVKATQIAASVGQGMALLFGFVGLFTNPFLVFIALFVWMGASQESAMAQAEALLDGVAAERAMLREFHSLHAGDKLENAVRLTLDGSQEDFPVLEGGRVVGILTQQDLLRGLSERGKGALVTEAMTSDFSTAEVGESLETAFKRLQTCQCRTLPVYEHGRLAGLLTRDNLAAFLSIQKALAQADESGGPHPLRANAGAYGRREPFDARPVSRESSL